MIEVSAVLELHLVLEGPVAFASGGVEAFDVELVLEAMTLNEPSFGHNRAGAAFADVEFPHDAGTFGRPFIRERRAGEFHRRGRFRASRRSTGFPAISAALMAPIEVPMTQSGSMPASWSAS